jgi:hypothetical protein
MSVVFVVRPGRPSQQQVYQAVCAFDHSTTVISWLGLQGTYSNMDADSVLEVEVVCYSSYWRRAPEQGWFYPSDRHHTAGVPVLPPAQPVCHHVCSDVEPATSRWSGTQRISESCRGTSMCGSTGTQSTKAPRDKSSTAGMVDVRYRSSTAP